LILSDINMQRGDGYALLARLREDPVTSAIPLIMMTGNTAQHDLRRVMEAGADDYLTKPFGPEVLLAAVQARLDRRYNERATRRVLGQILEATSDYVCVASAGSGEVVHLNSMARKLIGLTEREDVAARHVRDLFSKSAWEKVASEGISAALAQGRWTGESTFVDHDGAEIPVSQVILIHRGLNGEAQYFSIVARDISERIEAEKRLADSNRHLRDLAARLVSIQETERARIAREVHDEFGQQLTGLKIDLAWLEKRLGEAKNIAGRSQWLEKIAAMHEQIRLTIQTARRVATELRPGILDSLGLVPALECQAREFQVRTGIPCSFQSNAEQLDWDSDRSTALFRLFQEALTNVARHAQASSVSASLTEREGTVILVVQDSGVGIGDVGKALRKSTGLLGMKERALLVGGTIHFASQPNRGTTVTVEIPKSPSIKQT
jgi:PAS domain S-box-containing protein